MSTSKHSHEPGSDRDFASVFDGAAPRPRPTQEERDAVYAAVHGSWKNAVDQRRNKRRWYATGGLLAAGLLVALVLTLTPGAPQPGIVVAEIAVTRGDVLVAQGDSPVWHPLGADLTTITAGTRLRTLEGAVRVEMIGGGSLSMDAATVTAFEGDATIGMKQGRVYYDSGASDATIAVRTPLGVVRNQGTQFSVDLRNDEVAIAVRAGATVLESSRGGASVTRAGQRQVWFSDGQPPLLESIDADDPSFTWADALVTEFSLDGRTAMDYLEWVARERGYTLRFSTDAARLAARNAVFRGGGSARSSGDTLRLALSSVGLRADMRGTEIVISTR